MIIQTTPLIFITQLGMLLNCSSPRNAQSEKQPSPKKNKPNPDIYLSSLSPVSPASPESAKCPIILWITSLKGRSYFFATALICLWFLVVVRKLRNTDFKLIR